jgi:hypothetical protein
MKVAKSLKVIFFYLVYWVTIVPIGILLRGIGIDLLKRKWDKAAPTYRSFS